MFLVYMLLVILKCAEYLKRFRVISWNSLKLGTGEGFFYFYLKVGAGK